MDGIIILKYLNKEKELSKIPDSYSELKQLFHDLFPEAKNNIDYMFLIPKEDDENIIISEEDFQNQIEEILGMDEHIIDILNNDDDDDDADRIVDDNPKDNIEPIENDNQIKKQKNIKNSDKKNEELSFKNEYLENLEYVNKEQGENSNYSINISKSLSDDTKVLMDQLNDINNKYQE